MATTDSEDDDDIEFDLSTTFAADSSDWNDLPISPALAAPSFKTCNSKILKEHGIEEFYSDDEEWTQDVDGEWASRNANLFLLDSEEVHLSFSDEEEEFLSQDLAYPTSQHLTSLSSTKDHRHISDAQATRETASSDRDTMDFLEESQDDENREFPFMSLSNAGDLSQLPVEGPDQRPSQERPSNLSLRRHESTLSDAPYLRRMSSEDMDFHFDSKANAAIPNVNGGGQYPESRCALNLNEIPDGLVVCGPMVGSVTNLRGPADLIGTDENSGDFVLDFDM